jgi:protein-S-isoprenylcysteine O-methyltransferase Ste14
MLQLTAAYFLLIVFFMLESFFRKDKAAKSIEKTEEDNKSTYIIGLTFFVVFIASFIFNFFRIGTFNNPLVSTIGISIMCIGLCIRAWSMKTLNKYYTRVLTTTTTQQIIKKGPYKIIRHPGYLGTILVWSAAGLAMQNLIVFIIATGMLFIAYIYRINNEEKMLAARFGEKFKEYKKYTWRILPPVW